MPRKTPESIPVSRKKKRRSSGRRKAPPKLALNERRFIVFSILIECKRKAEEKEEEDPGVELWELAAKSGMATRSMKVCIHGTPGRPGYIFYDYVRVVCGERWTQRIAITDYGEELYEKCLTNLIKGVDNPFALHYHAMINSPSCGRFGKKKEEEEREAYMTDSSYDPERWHRDHQEDVSFWNG